MESLAWQYTPYTIPLIVVGMGTATLSFYVILSSGYDEQDVSDRFVGKGLAGFIQKPYRYQALREKVREVVEN